MVSILKDIYHKFINKGNERSVRVKKNLVCSFFLRGVDVAIGLALVPISLNYLDSERYGIWLTIESMVTWFVVLDIGMGNGLRNKIAELYAINDAQNAKLYISTTYAVMSFLALSAIALACILVYYFDLGNILNPSQSSSYLDIDTLFLFVLSAFSVKLVLNLVVVIWVAIQYPAVQYFVQMLSKLITVIILLQLTRYTNGSLFKLSAAYMLPPLFALTITTIYTYSKKMKNYKPSINSVQFSCAKPLMTVGIRFFIIQVGYIVLIMTDNIILTQLYGPASVAPYQIAHKYFGILSIIFIVLLSPMWSATTEAFVNRDIKWISQAVEYYIKIWLFFVMMATVMLFVSPLVYKFWIGESVFIPFSLSFSWAIFVTIQSLNAIYTYVLNGIGYLQIQYIGSLVVVMTNIPLSIVFAKYIGLGPEGVIVATIVSVLIYLISRYIQYNKIVNNKAYGIWIK